MGGRGPRPGSSATPRSVPDVGNRGLVKSLRTLWRAGTDRSGRRQLDRPETRQLPKMWVDRHPVPECYADNTSDLRTSRHCRALADSQAIPLLDWCAETEPPRSNSKTPKSASNRSAAPTANPNWPRRSARSAPPPDRRSTAPSTPIRDDLPAQGTRRVADQNGARPCFPPLKEVPLVNVAPHVHNVSPGAGCGRRLVRGSRGVPNKGDSR